MKKSLILLVSALLCVLIPFPGFARSEEDGASPWSFGLSFGSQSFFNTDYIPGGTESETLIYQGIGLHPEYRTENFDIAFDLVLRFRFDGGDNANKFEIREEDWKAYGAWRIFDLYLPKIRSARYGTKGDPFAARLGDIDGMTFGNGFIVSSYTNTLFQPENRVLGAVFNIDGSIVDIPYFGIEIFMANAAHFDFAAGRLHIFHLAAFDNSILKNTEIGGTLALDQNPFYFADRYSMYRSYSGPVLDVKNDNPLQRIVGLDFKVPLLTDPGFSFTLFGDWASQNSRAGWMGGASGRICSMFIWEAQYRYLDYDFLPGFYDVSYDLYRPEKAVVYESADSGYYLGRTIAYLGSVGLALFDDRFVFKVVSEGPLEDKPGRLYDWQGILELKEGLVPHFSFDILYSKKNMADLDDFATWKQDSLVRARIHYRAGPAVLSLVHIMRYIPTDMGKDRQALTGIEARIRF